MTRHPADRIRHPRRFSPVYRAVALLPWLVGGLLLAAPAGAGVWEAFSDANDLVSVTAVDRQVWCSSIQGLNLYDTGTGRFERFFRQPGGLVSNKVVTVEEDAFGNSWIGTLDRGLSLYTPDGAWRTVSEFDGLPSDSILVVSAFEDGVWIGTTNGLAYFVGTQIIAVWPDGVNPSPFRSDRIQAIASHQERTWIGTAMGVHSTFDGVSWDSTDTGLTDLDVQSLFHDGVTLWAVTSDGSVWAGGESGTWTETETGLGGALARKIGGREGAVYLGTSAGVFGWDRVNSVWAPISGSGAVPLDADVGSSSEGRLWAGNDLGLWEWQDTVWVQRRSPGPSGNYIHGMCMDGSTVYMATRFNGASRYDDARGWRHFKAGVDRDTSLISNDFIFAALCDREGDKWFGDWGGSIARLDDSGPTPVFTHYFINTNEDSVRYTLAWSSAHGPTGSRWFGLDTACRGCGPEFEPLGISRIDEDEYQNYNTGNGASMSANQVRAIAFAPDGTMWVGYADLGVDVFSNSNPSSRVARIVAGPDGLYNNNVWSIIFQGPDAWILTDGSAVRLSWDGASTTRMDQIFLPTISSRGAVNPLAIDAEGGVWVATARGIIYRAPGGGITQFTAANSPLLDDDVHSIVIDQNNGDVWIGTAVGVNRYRPITQETAASNGVQTLNVFPNPIRYSVIGMQFTLQGADGEPLVRTDVSIYDATGRYLVQLRTDDTGNLSWRPEDRFGRRLQAGVYYMRALGFDGQGRRIATGKGRLVVTP